jgi:hypothetical protein
MNTLKKKCSDCKLPKKLEEFPYDSSRDRHLSVCKSCTAIRTEAYRQNNKDKWKDNTIKHKIKVDALIKEWKVQGCAKCGDKREYVIDAHHLDPTKKDFSIGTTKRGMKITKEELKKCIPLCSNCHREFHHLEKVGKLTIKEYLKQII